MRSTLCPCYVGGTKFVMDRRVTLVAQTRIAIAMVIASSVNRDF